MLQIQNLEKLGSSLIVLEPLVLYIVCWEVFMPPPFIMGGHIASPLSVRPYVRPVRTKMVSGRYLLKTLGYWIHISYTGM